MSPARPAASVRVDAPALWHRPTERRWTGWLAALLASSAVAGLLTLLYVRNTRYFFLDDAQAQGVPVRVDIGRAVLDGHVPWLSTSYQAASAHAIEYSHAVFNPGYLLASVVLARLDDVALGSFLYVLAASVVLTLAATWLGRVLGLSWGWTTAFAVSLGFQPYTVVWLDAAWSEGTTSLAWIVLACAAAVSFHLRPRRRTGAVLLVSTYLAFTTGWPLALPALALFVAALAVARLLERSGLRSTLWLVAWAAAGGLCSLVAQYPLTTAAQYATRQSETSNPFNFNVVPLEALLQFANPSYYGFFNNFGGYALQQHPQFYVAWFVLPVLLLWQPGGLPSPVRAVSRAAGSCAVFWGFAALGPEHLKIFRFPTRYEQYFALFLLVWVAVTVAHGRFAVTRRRLLALLGVVVLLLLNTLQTDPVGVRRVLALGLPVLPLSALVWWVASRPGRLRGLAAHLPEAVLVLGTVALLTGVALRNPVGRGIDYGVPASKADMPTVSAADYTLFYGTYPRREDVPGLYREYRPANTGVLAGDRTVNGYSSIGNPDLRRWVPLDDQGNVVHPDAGAVTAVDAQTGVPRLELLRVDRLVAMKGPWADDIAGALPSSWQQDRTGTYTVVYRHAPYALPGLVSWVTPGGRAEPATGCDDRPTGECARITAAGQGGTTVLYARVWYPGYRATLDGREVPVSRHDGVLVRVDLPPGQSGVLRLDYRPPGLVPLGALALVTLLLVAGAAVVVPQESRPRRRPEHRGAPEDEVVAEPVSVE